MVVPLTNGGTTGEETGFRANQELCSHHTHKISGDSETQRTGINDVLSTYLHFKPGY
jgi:hypothetical protein